MGLCLYRAQRPFRIFRRRSSRLLFFLIFQVRFKRLSFEGFCLPVNRSGEVADKSISSGLFTSVHARVKRRIILSTNKIPRLLFPFGFGDDSENFCVPSTRRYENPVNPAKIRSDRSGVCIYIYMQYSYTLLCVDVRVVRVYRRVL